MTSVDMDPYGNPLASVGYARGLILDSSYAETRRLAHGQRIAAQRVRSHGAASIAVFTGNQRDFPLLASDLTTLAEEWVGPSLMADDLDAVAIAHLGGRDGDAVAVFNRTSAGIVAAIAAHAGGGRVLSVVPSGGRSHASVVRGSYIARADLTEIDELDDWAAAVATTPDLVIITTVTSALERMAEATIAEVATRASAAGSIVLLDEAYGARLRTVLYDGSPSLSFSADIAITNCDKAGLSGPRAGVLVGRPENVVRTRAWASEHGSEARAPIAAAALRSLQSYDPEHLRAEAAQGQALARALHAELGDVVSISDLGPAIDEGDVHALVFARAGLDPHASTVVPAETATAIGMILLAEHGILTVNTHGQPGARVSLRLKPTLDAMTRSGGIKPVVDAVLASLDAAAAIVGDPALLARTILGED